MLNEGVGAMKKSLRIGVFSGYDPRPWVEKFYEGVENHNYYFVITPHMVHSYRVDVMVPQRYIGKY